MVIFCVKGLGRNGSTPSLMASSFSFPEKVVDYLGFSKEENVDVQTTDVMETVLWSCLLQSSEIESWQNGDEIF